MNFSLCFHKTVPVHFSRNCQKYLSIHQLVHQQKFKTELEATTIENEVKQWTKQEKQFLINNDWPEISKLAKKFNYLK